VSDVLLRMTGITKTFGGIRALDAVDFDVWPGEVHALIGENGAGKSTLMNVLAGRFDDYLGQVVLRGRSVRLTNPRQALALGVAVIYQELSVLPNLTVAENILLGHEPGGRIPGTLNRAALDAAAARILEYLHFDLPLSTRVENLSAARQVLVEITRALRKDVRLLVFDEPTASLGAEDVQRLFSVIRNLKSRGLGVVYISHRLAELPQIADRATVLRDGRVVGTRTLADCKLSDLTRLMLGRDLAEVFPKRRRRDDAPAAATASGYPSKSGQVVLRVRDLTHPGLFENVSFDLHAGEILALAGLVGSGRTEIVRAILGAERASGTVELHGRPLRGRRPDRCRRLGLCMVPEGRQRDGLLTGRPVHENLNASVLEQLSGILGYLSPRRRNECAKRTIQRMKVDPPRPDLEVQKLSGGNQQKVIVGRTLAATPQVIIFDEPTQGIDVGTKAELYRLITDLAAEGRSILLISSELIELAKLADRILVIREGRVAGELPGADTDEELLFAACVGT
jgi:ribose transport system ATP-binding protein